MLCDDERFCAAPRCAGVADKHDAEFITNSVDLAGVLNGLSTVGNVVHVVIFEPAALFNVKDLQTLKSWFELKVLPLLLLLSSDLLM